MKIIVYQDLKHDNRHGYQMHEPQPDGKVVKEGILPAEFGFPAMYIRHMRFSYGGDVILLVSQTDYELDETKKEEIRAGAKRFIIQNGK